MFNIFLAGVNTKKFWNNPEGKYFAPLRILNLFIKSIVNPFVDNAFFWYFIEFISI